MEAPTPKAQIPNLVLAIEVSLELGICDLEIPLRGQFACRSFSQGPMK